MCVWVVVRRRVSEWEGEEESVCVCVWVVVRRRVSEWEGEEGVSVRDFWALVNVLMIGSR